MAPHFHDMADGRRIAFQFKQGAGPVLVFLPGYMSDMAGAKAEALMDWAWATDRGCLLLDYSGCGASTGDFAQGTLTGWCDEVLAVIAAQVPGQLVLVGSSMGGWLMLLVALALEQRARTAARTGAIKRHANRNSTGHVAGLVGIAAAPDFTEWGFAAAQKAELAAGRTVYRGNRYGSGAVPTHARFWADGQNHCLLDSAIAIDCPVRLLHGLEDPDVPWQTSLRLATALRSAQVQVTLVKDGDHRLSRPEDLELLIATIAGLETPGKTRVNWM